MPNTHQMPFASNASWGVNSSKKAHARTRFMQNYALKHTKYKHLLSPFMHHNGSLTRVLERISGSKITVVLLDEHLRTLSFDEKKALRVRQNQAMGFVRVVALCAGNAMLDTRASNFYHQHTIVQNITPNHARHDNNVDDYRHHSVNSYAKHCIQNQVSCDISTDHHSMAHCFSGDLKPDALNNPMPNMPKNTWVLAKAVMAVPLAGRAKRLRFLGAAPMGYVLFGRQKTLPFVRRMMADNVRQTRYEYAGQYVLITECFLDAFVQILRK